MLLDNLQIINHPKYEPEKWNSDEYIRRTHNCYAYALNIMDNNTSLMCEKYMKKTGNYDCPVLRPQPGQYSGFIDEYKPHPFSCEKLERRMKKDNPLIRKIKKTQICPIGYYRIALVTASDGSDYHFIRQDNTGLWSQKDGFKNATNKDAKRVLIRNPEIMALPRHLDTFCGYYMVPNEAQKKHMSCRTRPHKGNISAFDKIRIQLNSQKKCE